MGLIPLLYRTRGLVLQELCNFIMPFSSAARMYTGSNKGAIAMHLMVQSAALGFP